MIDKQENGMEKQPAKPMDQPLKKHGDKMKSVSGDKKEAEHQPGGAGEPETTPLEPEEQGGIGGP